MQAISGDLMRSFTLDTNCLIALDEGRPEAGAVRELADAHAAGIADVAVVAISASERQAGGRYIENFDAFRKRMADLGVGHLNMVHPLAYFDITFWDYSLWSDQPMQELEQQVHKILFPNVEFKWEDYCVANKIESQPLPSGKWRNCKCDVLAIWSHINAGRDVFVTSDRNFHAESKCNVLIGLGANHIAFPDTASALLETTQY